MAKQGMKKIDCTHTKPKNEAPPVPEIQGKVKYGKVQTNPIIEGTTAPAQKEKPISSAYPAIDTDLARDNLENHLSAADLQDL